MTKVKYDMSKNYFKCYNESQGMMINKKQVLKKKNKKVFGYLEQGLLFLLYTIIISILSKLLWFLDAENVFSDILSVFVALLLVWIAIYYVAFLIAYIHEKKKSHKGELIIDEDGITDISEEKVKVGLPWEKIQGVVATKTTVTIITNSPVYFFVGNDEKEKLLKAIQKYQENLLIIEK